LAVKVMSLLVKFMGYLVLSAYQSDVIYVPARLTRPWCY